MNTTPRPPTQYPPEFKQILQEKRKNFVCREFVFTAITDFVHHYNRGYFTIVGAPGSGKSVILAKYVRDNSQVVYYNAQVAGKNSAEEFLKSVCTQLIQAMGNGDVVLPDNVTEGSWFLSLLLQKISEKLEPNRRLIITIDALDAIDDKSQSPGSNLFYLPRYLPDGVYFFLTRRPFLREKSGLLIETPSHTLNLAAYPEQNREGVQTYIRQFLIIPLSYQRREENFPSQFSQRSNLKSWLTSLNISEEEFCTRLTTEAENNFMYLSQILPAIAKGFYRKPFQRHQLPPGLEAYYQQHWQKMKGQGLSGVTLGVLRVLTSVEKKGGISVEAIAQMLDEDEYEVNKVLENWLEFLQQQRVGRETRYSLYHSSFCDWLAQRLGDTEKG